MKALVLSGGAGTRLRPFTYSMPKQLIPIANKPVLQHVVENIRELGVTQIAVIVGDWEYEISAVLGDGSRFGAEITYIRQDEPRGLAHCVTIAGSFLGDDDFVMYLGDNMLPDGVVEMARRFRADEPAAQVVVHKMPDPRGFGVAELAGDGSVLRVVEKPPQPVSDLVLMGVYFFTSAIHRAIDAIEPSARGELEITDAIQWLVADGADVRASEYVGYWKDTGNVEAVLDCNRELLDRLQPLVVGEVDDATVLTGPVVLEPGACVVRSTIEGPAIIGAGTLVQDSHIGPYTSIGDNCLLQDTHVDYSIALDGAHVRGVRGLHGSLIGRSALVEPAETGAAHHRLVVGDHTRVEVAV